MEDLDEIFRECGLPRGRCFGSKSFYRGRNPNSIFLPNACICTSQVRVWGGDLDLSTRDASNLMAVAKIVGESLYVMCEAILEPTPETIQKYAQFVVSQETIAITERGWSNVSPELGVGTIIVRRSE